MHTALYRLYPYKLLLTKESVQGVLTLLKSLDIDIPAEDLQHRPERIASVELKNHANIGKFIYILIPESSLNQ